MQSMRTGYLVYVFQGDEERMKGNPERNWKLYGLWTHSSSPVVQYVSEKTRNLEDMMSLELLGYCISNDYKDDITRTMPHSGPLLIIENNGVELKAKIYKRNGLAPVSCFIKVLPMESPFSNLFRRSGDEISSKRRETSFTPQRNVTNYREQRQLNNKQWYSTPEGEKRLKNIYACITQSISGRNEVEMIRNTDDLNIQISIKHSGQTFDIHFPVNFPETSAYVLLSTSIFPSKKLHEQVKSKEDIVKVIKNYCSCHGCKYSR